MSKGKGKGKKAPTPKRRAKRCAHVESTWGDDGDGWWKRCDDCGELLPLGPSNDDSEAVRVEMRAADQIADMAAYGAGESHMWRNDDIGTLTNTSDGPFFDGFNSTLWPWDPTRPLAGQYEEHLAALASAARDGGNGLSLNLDIAPPIENGVLHSIRDGCSLPIAVVEFEIGEEPEDGVEFEIEEAHEAGADCPMMGCLESGEAYDTDDIPIRAGAPEAIGLTPRQLREQTAAAVASEDALRDPEVTARNAEVIAKHGGPDGEP